jgi:hypothetical protein
MIHEGHEEHEESFTRQAASIPAYRASQNSGEARLEIPWQWQRPQF